MNGIRDPSPILLGRYQPISELATSPIGSLAMALDITERRVVAVRSLRVDDKLARDAITQLIEASRWLQSLDDPAVMKPLDVGIQQGLFHAVFCYNLAEPLRVVLRLASFKGSPMPVGVALRIATDITLGACAVQAIGAPAALGESLCGGLMPDSVLVGADGKSRLCDVGIGAILRRTEEFGQHPDVLSYAAPEQLRGGTAADGRSDVFAIGTLLWEMLACRRLFSAHQADTVSERIRTLTIPSLDSIPRIAEPIPAAVVEIVKVSLKRSPAERYAGTSALLQALRTQVPEPIATPEAVQLYVSALAGDVFESRLRSIERSIALQPQRLSVASKAQAGHQKPLGLPRIPLKQPSPADTNKPSRLITVRPTPVAVLPPLPSQFELRHAEFFASPGLPATSSATLPTDAVASPMQLFAPHAECPLPEEAVNPIGPTIPAPAYDLPSAQAMLIGPLDLSTPLERHRRKSRVAWLAIASVAACAFVGGISLRRCISSITRGKKVSQDAIALSNPVTDNSVTVASIVSDRPAQTDSAAPDGAASFSAMPIAAAPSGSNNTTMALATSAQNSVRRIVPHSRGKVVKGGGKIAR